MSALQPLLSRDRPACAGFPRGEAECDVRSGEPAADDLAALRLVKVPDWPPFDGELAAGDTAAGDTAAGQFGSGWAYLDPCAGAYPLASTSRWSPCAAGAGSPARAATDDGGDARAPETDRLETSGAWARQFAPLLAEALAGVRPFRQIVPWTSERARVQIRRLMPLFGGGQRPRVLRVMATRPTREVIEMTVIVTVGARTRALAIRLERAGPRRPAGPAGHTGHAARAGAPPRSTPGWVCTDIEAA